VNFCPESARCKILALTLLRDPGDVTGGSVQRTPAQLIVGSEGVESYARVRQQMFAAFLLQAYRVREN
jgi:hypothetical protein